MTQGQKTAGLTFLGILAGAALLRWIFCRTTVSNPRNPWVTLKQRLRRTGKRQRVFIDDDGRIERGLPKRYRGIRISDLSKVNRDVRKMRKRAGRARAALERRGATRFKTKDTAVKALLDANPRLADFVQREWGQSSQAYAEWLRRGRRGPKPQLGSYDGRFDSLNYGHDLHGARAVGSWLEALYATAPTSGRWEDFAERLPALEEATGLRLVMPEAAEGLQRGRGELEAFDAAADDEEDSIYMMAKRAAAGDELEEAPF